MSKIIQMVSITPQELQHAILEGVKEHFQAFKKELRNKTEQDDLMCRDEVLKLLKINESTLWHWQKKGKITVYKFSNKCYYKRTEIMASITPVKY